MTPAEMAVQSRIEQGLPAHVEDERFLSRIADGLRTARPSPGTHPSGDGTTHPDEEAA